MQLFRNHIQILKYIPRLRNIYYTLQTSKKSLFDFYEKQVDEHQKRVDHDSESSDYVEAFLKEKAKKEAEGNGEEHYFTYVKKNIIKF